MTPEVIINNVILRLKNNLSLFPADTVVTETSEDEFSGANPPYLGVYIDFDEDCQILPLGMPKDIPISLYVICHSPGNTSAAASFSSALDMAMRSLKLLIGEYDFNYTDNGIDKPGYIFLESKEKPFLVLRNSASGSVVLVQLKYTINLGDI